MNAAVMNAVYTGTRSSNGIVQLTRSPDLSRGKQKGDYVGLAAMPIKTARVRITGSATVAMEGSNGDPANANSWEELGRLTTTGVINDDNPWQWVRFSVTGYGSGDVIVDLNAAG